MNHIAEIKTIQMVTRQKVLQLLGWDELEHAEFFMNEADIYLKSMMGNDARGIQKLKGAATFWAWFKNHWHRRDMRFVGSGKLLNSVVDRIHLYKLTHDGDTIGFRPHSAIMKEAAPDKQDSLETLTNEMEAHLKKAEALADQINKIQERSKK